MRSPPWVAACVWVAAFAAVVPSPARAQTEALGRSEHFELVCLDAARCGAAANPEIAAGGARILVLAEDARRWLEGLDFPVAQSHLHPQNAQHRRLLVDPGPPAEACPRGADPVACHRSDLVGWSRIHLPLVNVPRLLMEPNTLAHEYVHTLQPDRDPGALGWVNEAVAEAVGTMFYVRHGGGEELYPPKRLMTLDRPFYDDVEGGYGKWAYFLRVGEELGSPDKVAYLAQEGFLAITHPRVNQGARAASDGMRPLYDRALVGEATFDRVFPKFVASLNNDELSSDADDSIYLYYADIATLSVEVDLSAPLISRDFEGVAPRFAVAPLLLEFAVRRPPQAEPKDTLLMVDLELVAGDPLADLTLVVEHRVSATQHLERFMVDGYDPPAELGLVRVVNTPPGASGADPENAYRLRVRTRPIALDPPSCFVVGEPASMEARGFSAREATNWRLVSDNGSVDGLAVTPARAGNVTLVLSIDSPITRQEGTLAPRQPAATEVALGTFEVAPTRGACPGEAWLRGTGRGRDVSVRTTVDDANFPACDDGCFTVTPGLLRISSSIEVGVGMYVRLPVDDRTRWGQPGSFPIAPVVEPGHANAMVTVVLVDGPPLGNVWLDRGLLTIDEWDDERGVRGSLVGVKEDSMHGDHHFDFEFFFPLGQP